MASKSKPRWDRDMIKKLIKSVQAREALWNVGATDYSIACKRRAALAEISQILQMPVEEIKRKIHTLRTQYHKERTKMEKTFRTVLGKPQRYSSKWEFFGMMRFMFQHIEKTDEAAIESNVSGFWVFPHLSADRI